MAVSQRNSNEEEKRRRAEKYIEEERKIESLSDVISMGLSKITGFLIDSKEKKRTENRLSMELDLRLNKLEAVYESSINPLVRKTIITAIDEIKSVYSVGMMEIERIYCTNMRIEDKLTSYKDIETSTIDDMDATITMTRKEIERIRGS